MIAQRANQRLGGVWPQLVSFENLALAFRKARQSTAAPRGQS